MARFLGRVAEEGGQDHRRALLRDQRPERAGDEVAVLHGGEGIIGLRQGHDPSCRPQAPSIPAPELVHGDSIQVPLRTLHRRDPVPALEDPDEGVLHDLFGLLTTACHEAERAKEADVLGPEEVFEGLGRILHGRWPGIDRDHPKLSIHRAP